MSPVADGSMHSPLRLIVPVQSRGSDATIVVMRAFLFPCFAWSPAETAQLIAATGFHPQLVTF
jgi:hypothetical protein